MKTVSQYLTFILFISIFFSCKDFIEEDIDKETIQLLAPTNNLQTVELTHTFWWDDLDGAEEYKMQIVEGTFTSAIKLVLDSTVGINKFNYTLYPGKFQWRVKGMNNGSETVYTTYTLTIDSTNDISTQTVVLLSPVDGMITNQDSITFRWNDIYLATSFNIDIRKGSWSGTSVTGLPINTTSTEYTLVLNDGIYEWGVQAENASSNTFTGFTQQTLTIDTQVPDTVALSLPLNNAVIGDSNYTYTWTHPTTDNGTALTDSIFFYTDVNGINLIKAAQGISNSYTDSLGIGTYYWRVASSDEAGNLGAFTTMRSFSIQ